MLPVITSMAGSFSPAVHEHGSYLSRAHVSINRSEDTVNRTEAFKWRITDSSVSANNSALIPAYLYGLKIN